MPSKRRRRPVSSDRRFRRNQHINADFGPRERWQHSGRTLEPTEQAGVLAARATEEHVIDLLVLRGALTKTESDAAFRFKLDYHRANIEARLTGRYSAASSVRDFFSTAHYRSDAEEAAYQRWRNAVRELGMILADPVISTVCHDMPPTPRDLAHVQKGLKKLADWYGLPDETQAPAAIQPLRENVEKSAARSVARKARNLGAF